MPNIPYSCDSRLKWFTGPLHDQIEAASFSAEVELDVDSHCVIFLIETFFKYTYLMDDLVYQNSIQNTN